MPSSSSSSSAWAHPPQTPDFEADDSPTSPSSDHHAGAESPWAAPPLSDDDEGEDGGGSSRVRVIAANTNLQKVTERTMSFSGGGWWHGQNAEGVVGKFPAACVELVAIKCVLCACCFAFVLRFFALCACVRSAAMFFAHSRWL